jgi:hypothetical protein
MQQHFETEKITLAAQKQSIQLKLFVAGPYLDPSQTVPPENGENLTARKARFLIVKKLQDELGALCVLGEHGQLQAIYKEHFGKHSNASLVEVAHVTDHSDGVIILPSSPGSFSELGHFSALKKVCPKMLVLIDRQYEENQGYIQLGPAKLAQMCGATVTYIDYADIDALLNEAVSFAEDLKVKKLYNKFLVTGD